MDVLNRTEADAVLEAAAKIARPIPGPDGVEYVVAPNGSTLLVLDPEAVRAHPRRAKGTYSPATVAGLIAYLNEHGDPAGLSVWVHPTSGRIVAIVNDHTAEDPGWRDWRAVTQLELTPQWRHWLSLDGKMVGQEPFAEHIEQALEDIVDPAAATMLEVAQSLHARKDASFASSIRLDSGQQQFKYDEVLTARAGGAGNLEIPTEIVLSLSPFVGERPYRVTARFRFRINDGRLSLGYKLDRPDLIVRDALDTVARTLAERFPRVYVGSEPE